MTLNSGQTKVEATTIMTGQREYIIFEKTIHLLKMAFSQIKDTTSALTMSPGLKEACISTLSISVALTSCCLFNKRSILIYKILQYMPVYGRRGSTIFWSGYNKSAFVF
jgi:hypothetical protein